MTHTIKVEKDELKPDHFMVVIRNDEGQVVGIPLRSVTHKVASESRDSLRYAFDYGVREATRKFQASLWSIGHVLGCER